MYTLFDSNTSGSQKEKTDSYALSLQFQKFVFVCKLFSSFFGDSFLCIFTLCFLGELWFYTQSALFFWTLKQQHAAAQITLLRLATLCMLQPRLPHSVLPHFAYLSDAWVSLGPTPWSYSESEYPFNLLRTVALFSNVSYNAYITIHLDRVYRWVKQEKISLLVSLFLFTTDSSEWIKEKTVKMECDL